MTTTLASAPIREATLPAAPETVPEASYSRLFWKALLKGILVALGLLLGGCSA